MILTVGSSIKDESSNIYILDEIIGHGGFGYVFKAHRKKDKATFAVKTMLPSFSDNMTAEAFKNEIASAMCVCGENIIRYEYIHSGDAFPNLPPYIIMEYANGGTLSGLLKAKRQSSEMFELSEVLDIFRQLSTGMKIINTSLVHRDIKPDNILICGNTLKISDFGLSKIAAEGTRTMTFKGGGTPLYMAPEAWDYSKNTFQMDIYAMGVVFFEIATMQYPYSMNGSTIEDYKNAHLYSAITSPVKLNPSLSASIVSLITRMLEKPTQRRFTNWDEIINHIGKQEEPQSEIASVVSMAISSKNAEDILRQHQINEANRKEKEKTDFCRMVHSQFENVILAPIRTFVEQFNSQYAGNEKYVLPRNDGKYTPVEHFSWNLQCPSCLMITFDMEILLKENHQREVHNDPIFRDMGTRMVNYIPQYENQDILLWGEVSNSNGFGVNLVLLKGDGLYGDWLILTNTNSGLSRSKRAPEPFAFKISELPKEINHIKATHIYNTNVEPLNDEILLQLVSELSKKH